MVLQRPIFPFVIALCWIFCSCTNLHAECFRQNAAVPSPIGQTTSSIFTHLADGSKPSLKFVIFETTAPLVTAEIQHQQQRQAFIDTVSRFVITVKTLRYRFLSALVDFQTTIFDTGRMQDASKIYADSFIPKFAALFFLVLQDASFASRIDCVFNTLLFQPNERSWSHIEWGINPTTDCVRNSQPGQEDHSGYSASTSRVPTTTSTALQMTASADDASVIQQREVPIKMVTKDNETEELPNVTTPFSWENQWFPVLPVSCLKGLDPNKPVPVSILGCNLVVWKS